MRKPAADKEDPNVVAAREREERRAESFRTSETQALLVGATQRRLRRTGRIAGESGGNVSLVAPSGGGSVMGGGSGYSGSSGGGFSGGFGGMGDNQIALY